MRCHRILFAVALAVAGAGAAGCHENRPGPVDLGAEMLDELAALHESTEPGERLSLHQIVQLDWDRVGVFNAADSTTRVEQMLGVRRAYGLLDPLAHGNYVLFAKGTEVVAGFNDPLALLGSGPAVYSGEVLVVREDRGFSLVES